MNEKTKHLIKERVSGALWGLSLGDAYGMPMEMWPPEKRREILGEVQGLLPGHPDNDISKGRAAGETTDDTAFSRLICELLIEAGTVVPDRLVGKITDWLHADSEKNGLVLGPSTRRAIEDITNGMPIEEAGANGRSNGAAMRILPVGIAFDWEQSEAFVQEVHKACLPTHNTNLALSSACAVAAAVSCAVRGGTVGQAVEAAKALADKAADRGRQVSDTRISARIDEAIYIALNAPNEQAMLNALYTKIGAGLPAEESIPTAIALFRYAAADPMLCARLCANIGGDTDTIGAIACGLSGAVAGVGAICRKDIDRIQKAGGINWEPHAEALIALSARQTH